MLPIELYENYLMKNQKEKPKEEDLATCFTSDDFTYLVSYENGKLIESDQCILEFYFLLLCGEYDIANILLTQSYARELKDIINQMFIGDESNLFEHIMKNVDLIKGSIKCALQRQLDGVA